MERRLAAILCADVVGFSRLVGADEEGALRRLAACRDLIETLVAAHHGRIFGGAGDSVIVEFASPVEATRCAIAIQAECAARNAGLPEGGRMEFRIGVNLGDVVVEGDNLMGDGVNIAARLQEIAPSGGVCVSGEVRGYAEGRVERDFEDIGLQRLKNIARPVPVHRLRTRAAPDDTAPAPPENARPAIAVLPFANMSADAEQEYFSDGLTEDIITALTLWRQFPVIARNSCFAYKNRNVDIKQVGRELDARYVLEGGVRKAGARIRITAQLIDGASGHHIWAEKYDGDLTDIFEVQDDIVQRIAAHVAPELTRAELQRGAGKRPEDLGVWDLCLRGMAHIRKRTAEDNARARALFERALAIRPDHSDAHSGIAMAYNSDILSGAAKDRGATTGLALEAARKAVECDEASAWAHHELSTAYQWNGRTEDALAEARISVDLNPNDAYGLHALGNKSDLAGDPAGVAHMERAQKLNPADAQLHNHLTFLARAHVNAGDPAAAEEKARRAIRRRPEYPPAHYILAIALAALGRAEEARAALAACDDLSPGFVKSRETWAPYADPESNERLRAPLRALGGG